MILPSSSSSPTTDEGSTAESVTEHDRCFSKPAPDSTEKTSGTHNNHLPPFCLSCRDPSSGCRSKQWNYNSVGEAVGLRCSSHRLPTDVDIRRRVCYHNNIPPLSDAEGGVSNSDTFICPEYPIYGPVVKSKGLCVGVRCSLHRLPTDFCVIERRVCETPGCGKRPSYKANDGQSKLSRCKRCSLPTDVRTFSKLCRHDGCDKSASFGSVNGPPMWCSRHKSEGATTTAAVTSSASSGKCGDVEEEDEIVHLTSYRCIFSEEAITATTDGGEQRRTRCCKMVAYYGRPTLGPAGSSFGNFLWRIGESPPLYCKFHKPENFVHSSIKSCFFCDKIALRRSPRESDGKYACKNHWLTTT